MPSKRATRRNDRQQRTRVVWTAAIVMAVLGIAIAGGLVAWARSHAPATVEVTPSAGSTTSSTDSSVASSSVVSTASVVEVPPLEGLAPSAAKVLLEAAGLKMSVRTDGDAVAKSADAVVAKQEPASGTTVAPGANVVVFVPPIAKPKAPSKAKVVAEKPAAHFVVVIDPGHQARSDMRSEPIGPGASETKPRVMGGATGTRTKVPEYEVALEISMNLKKRLEDKGIKVVMTRTTNDVNLSNSERAKVANRAGADLFVRIHGDGNPDSSMSGISTLYPESNRWTKSFAATSRKAAGLVQRGAVGQTGAVDRGTVARGDLSGFNYATVPSVLVECGFLSNPVEDQLLSSPNYQDKVAEGITQGVISYLEGKK